MRYIDEIARYQKTEKQKSFGADFLEPKQIDDYEFWDEIEIGKETVAPMKFEVKAEDVLNYIEAVPDANPVFHDEKYARKCGYDGLIAHPIFIIEVLFFLLRKGPGTLIRTPGARNPGQILEWYDPIRVGDVLTLKLKSYDKWIKRGKYYMRYRMELYDQNGKLKIVYFMTQILPRSKADVLKFVEGEHALEA
jgi:acyl dehydratase